MADWILDSSSTEYLKQIPYQEDFADLIEIDTYPNTSWKLDSSSTYELKQIPYKVSFADMYKINDTPNSAWVLESASKEYLKQIPYKRSFSSMKNYFDAAPKSMWVLNPESLSPYKLCFPIMGSLWDRNLIRTIDPDCCFEDLNYIGNYILRAIDLHNNQAIRHISIELPNVAIEEDDILSLLESSDGFYIEGGDEISVEKEENEEISIPLSIEEEEVQKYYIFNNGTFSDGYSYEKMSLVGNNFSLKNRKLSCLDLNSVSSNAGCMITPIITQDFIRENEFTKICVSISGTGCSITSGYPEWTHAKMCVGYEGEKVDGYSCGDASIGIGANYNGEEKVNMGVFNQMEFSLNLNLLEEKDFYLYFHTYRFGINIHSIWFE